MTSGASLVRALGSLAVSLGLCLAWTGSVRAQDLVVVGLGGSATEAERAPLLADVVARFTAEGFAVLGPGELVHRVPPSHLALTSTEDAARLATEVNAPRVACVSVWSSGGAVTELSMSLHALSGGRSIRSATASGVVSAEHPSAAIVAEMVGQVLAAERAAAMLDPGIGSGSAGAGESGSGGGGGGGSGSTGASGSEGGGGGGSGSTGGSGSGSSSGSGSTGGGGSGGGSGPRSSSGPEPLFGILGPGLLAAVGAAGVGLGVWASLDPTCNLRGASGVCLRGEENNLGLGILMISLGTLSLAGAIVWWVTDAQAPPNEPRIDVVLGPGSAGVRGTF